MRVQLAALALTFVVAVTASVFAIWPAVTDAPWEVEVAAVEEGADTVRCAGALSFRDTIIRQGKHQPSGGINGAGNPSGLRDYDEQLAKAGREITQYC